MEHECILASLRVAGVCQAQIQMPGTSHCDWEYLDASLGEKHLSLWELSPKQAGQPLPQCQTRMATNSGDAPLGNQAPAPLQCGRVPPQPGISPWQEERDYTELAELFCQAFSQRVTKAWQDMLISFSRHHFPQQQGASAGLKELQQLSLLVFVSEGDRGNCLVLPHKVCERRTRAAFVHRDAPHRPGRE